MSSGDGAVGAAKLTGEVLGILDKLPDTVEKLTGISISQVPGDLGSGWGLAQGVLRAWMPDFGGGEGSRAN